VIGSSQNFLLYESFYTFQAQVTETAASTGRLIQARAEELETVILDLNHDVLKRYAAHANFLNLVDREIQSNCKLLSGFPWPINGNSENKLESLCISFLKNCSVAIKPCFVSAYLCESLVSTLKISLRAAILPYSPKFE
jgi:hypothetical protein